MLGAEKVLDCPGWMSPVLNPPLVAVRVWATWSLLVTVTVAPGATVVLLGEKAKFWMAMVWEWEADPPDADDEHAAKEITIPRRATMVALCMTRDLPGPGEGPMSADASSSVFIDQCSMPTAIWMA